MEELTITLPEETAARLKAAARTSGVKPEEFVRASLEERLAKVDGKFIQAMNYVLKKNAELYLRLAK